jgi:flagellar M-ring protein FliF
MDQLKKLFAALTLAQKIGLALALLAVGVGVPMFTHWQKESDFKPLFTNMAPEDAAAVLQKLKESGVDHRLADNGMTVLVPEAKVNDVRLELAGAGLPKSGRIGFELFDKTNLGVTDFSEKVNYRRALEGELERTIKAINSIESARVHITFPKDSVFLDNREPAKASVLVKLRVGATLLPQNVLAISNLVGSAVEGLSPDAVTVVDMQGNLLSKRKRSGDGAGAESGDALLDYRHDVEKDLTSKVESTLEPLLGEGRFRVGVSADCDISTSEQTDETYDPTRSVMSTSQKTEDLSNSGTPGGVPGTASNLPRSTIKPLAGTGSGSGMSRRTESMAFETSRSVRSVKMPRGSIKRVSVAVLLDQDFVWQGQGKLRKHVLTAPTPERIKSIHDIVVGVLGIQADRGDQVVIESLPFEQTLAQEDAGNEPGAKADKTAPLTPLAKLLADRRVQIGAGVAILVLLLAVVFLMMGKKKASVEMGHPALAAASDAKPGSTTTHEISAASNDTDGGTKVTREVHEITEVRNVRDGGGASTQIVSAQSPAAALPISAKLALPEMDSATRMMLHQIQDHAAGCRKNSYGEKLSGQANE